MNDFIFFSNNQFDLFEKRLVNEATKISDTGDLYTDLKRIDEFFKQASIKIDQYFNGKIVYVGKVFGQLVEVNANPVENKSKLSNDTIERMRNKYGYSIR